MKRLAALVVLVGMLLLGGCGQSGTPVPVVTKTIVVTVLPTESPPSSSAPSTDPAVGKGEWAAVACGSYHTLALKQNGTLWAWGLNDYGQLGQGTIDGSAHATPTQVGHAHDWATVSCGYGDSFAVKRDGTLWAWGNNYDFSGNLGLGDREERCLLTDPSRPRPRLGDRPLRLLPRPRPQERRRPVGLGGQLLRRPRRGIPDLWNGAGQGQQRQRLGCHCTWR